MLESLGEAGSVRALILLAAIGLGSCSSEIVQSWTSGPAADLSEPNHRRIIADDLKAVFPAQTPTGPMEISGIRQVDHFKGPAWLTCLKLETQGSRQHYAVFIQDGRIVDSRIGILLDQCHRETYTPFELSDATKKSDGRQLGFGSQAKTAPGR